MERFVCQAVCPTIKNCSSHIIRLKEVVLLHQHNEVQVCKGSTSLLSGYLELCLCLQVLNCRNYGASSLLEEKKERKKTPTSKISTGKHSQKPSTRELFSALGGKVSLGQGKQIQWKGMEESLFPLTVCSTLACSGN